MRSLLVVFILYIWSSLGIASGSTISEVEFIGEKPAYKLNLYSRANREFYADSLGADSLKIVGIYRERGWYDCRLTINTIKRTDGMAISFTIRKGDLYHIHIDKSGLSENDSLVNSIIDVIDSYENKPGVSANLNSLADELISYYAENGYPYCEIRFNDFRLAKPDSLIVSLDIQPGPAVTVERFVFEGIKNIKPEFLQRYLGLESPSVYSKSINEVALNRLLKADFIEEADNYRLRYLSRPERGIVVFPIRETPSLILDGAAGYSSDDGEFYGKFNATISNILGKGRQAEINWAKKDKHSRWLQFTFGEPYPIGIPFKMKIKAYQDDRDSVFIENGASIGLHYLGSDIFSYGVTIGISRLDPESYGRAFLAYKDKLRLSVSFTADSRDYPQNPHGGEYLYLSADFVTETTRSDSLFAASNTDYRTAELITEKYLPFAGSSVMYLSLHAQGDFSDNVPVDRQYPLGGFGSLRGYMQDQFYVSQLAVGTAEYRLLTSRRGRAYIFGDGAIYRIPKLNEDGSDTEYKAGVGMGLAASVKLGVATVEIAIPAEEGFGDTKIHFGLKAGF